MKEKYTDEQIAEAIVYSKFAEWVNGFINNPNKEEIEKEKQSFFEMAGQENNFLFSLYYAYANGFNAGIELCNDMEKADKQKAKKGASNNEH